MAHSESMNNKFHLRTFVIKNFFIQLIFTTNRFLQKIIKRTHIKIGYLLLFF